MNKTAIIVGSTGLTGGYLLEMLLNSDEYTHVISFVRKKSNSSHPKLKEHEIDFDNPTSYIELIKGDNLFCCLGTTIKKAGSQTAFEKVDLIYPLEFARIGCQNGVKQFLIISALGADSKSGNFYIRTKGGMEDALKQMKFQSIAIFRPSLLLGDRKEFRLGEVVGSFLMRALSFLFIGRFKKYKAIKSKIVAKAIFQTSLQNNTGIQIFESDEIREFERVENYK